MGGWENRGKERRFTDWDRDSLIGEAKTAGTSKAKKEFIHYFPSARQVLSHFPVSRASACLRVTQEDKCHKHKRHPLFSTFPELLLLNMVSDGMEYPSGQSGSAILTVSPGCICWGRRGAEEEKETAFMLRRYCSAIAKTLVSYQHCFSHKSKTQQHMGYYGRCEFYPSQYTYYNSYW